MASISIQDPLKNFNTSPLPQQEPLDKTLIAGSVVTGVLFGVPAGIAFATGYLASKENVASRWGSVKSFLGKAVAPIATLAKLKDLTNFGLISSCHKTIIQIDSQEELAKNERIKAHHKIIGSCQTEYRQEFEPYGTLKHCEKILENPLTPIQIGNPECADTCRTAYRIYSEKQDEISKQASLFNAETIPLNEALHDRQSAIALSTEALGAAGALYCAGKTWNELRQGRKLRAASWGLAGIASGSAVVLAYLKNQIVQKQSLFYSWPMQETNQFLNHLALGTGLTGSVFSAIQTSKALKENKLLEAVQWFSLSMCSATLAYAASNMPNIKY